MFSHWFPRRQVDLKVSRTKNVRKLSKSRRPGFESLDERRVMSASHGACLPDSTAEVESDTDEQRAAALPLAASLAATAQATSQAAAAAALPQGTSTTVRMSGSTFIFTPANFGFSDPNDSPANQFTGVMLTTLPPLGTMMFRGAGVAKGQVISFADLQSVQLSFRTSGTENKSYTSFTFQVQDSGGGTDPSPKTFNLIFDNSRANFVRGLYSDLLNRQPDTSGLLHWLDRLDSGQSNLSVGVGMWQTAEHRGIQVDGYYNQFLGRAADSGGRQFWINQMIGGLSEENVMVAFMSTTEYQLNHPSNSAFVTAVYQDVLNRNPDAGGLTFWVNALNNGQTRSQVARGLVDTVERHQNLVTSYYLTYFRRFPDSNGLAFWTDQLNRKIFSDAGVAQALLATFEYQNLRH